VNQKTPEEPANALLAFASAPIGLCYLDADLRYRYVNRWLANLNGLSIKQHLGKTIQEVVQEVAAEVVPQLRHVLETGEPIIDGVAESATPATNGAKRFFRHSYHPDFDSDGDVVGVRCVVQDVTELRTQQAENEELRQEVSDFYADKLIGECRVFKNVISQAERVAATDSTVLLLGDTGTGKCLIAERIHKQSRRSHRPLVKVNCAALPSPLIESELFGHEKGAFTGAIKRKIGRFELADGGTIFLDEIGDLPTELQVKLLRILHDGEFERVGSSTTMTVDVRVIAATNRDLGRLIEQGAFRDDLYYRLAIFPIRVPALRERRDDIPLLVWFFISYFQNRLGKTLEDVSAPAMDALVFYDWPGNVRELMNVVERAMILSDGSVLELADCFPEIPEFTGTSSRARGRKFETIEEIERAHIERVLEACHWKVSGREGASELLGLNRTTLQARMKKLGIVRPTS